MPPGDAGLERQPADSEYRTICGWVTTYGWLNAAMAERVRQLLHRQQAVIDAAREVVASSPSWGWIQENGGVMPGTERLNMTVTLGPFAQLAESLDAIQTVQSEGEHVD